MIASDVAELYSELEHLGVRIWIDGGWGVDALLKRQTRVHADLDIAVEERDLAALCAVLKRRGYDAGDGAKSNVWNFVLTDSIGRKIDVHAFVLDLQGNGILGPAELNQMYPAGALKGIGEIDKVPVRCVAPAFMVKFKTTYPPRDIDRADIKAICERFGIASPLE
jgi:lincosamide nucleotidyltransferase A/C/D/E